MCVQEKTRLPQFQTAVGQRNKSSPADACLPSPSPRRLWVIEHEQISNRKPISHREALTERTRALVTH